MLVIEIAFGIFLGLAAWRFRWPLLITAMTLAGLILWGLCGLAVYYSGFHIPKGSELPSLVWFAAFALGSWLLGPLFSLIGVWLARAS